MSGTFTKRVRRDVSQHLYQQNTALGAFVFLWFISYDSLLSKFKSPCWRHLFLLLFSRSDDRRGGALESATWIYARLITRYSPQGLFRMSNRRTRSSDNNIVLANCAVCLSHVGISSRTCLGSEWFRGPTTTDWCCSLAANVVHLQYALCVLQMETNAAIERITSAKTCQLTNRCGGMSGMNNRHERSVYGHDTGTIPPPPFQGCRRRKVVAVGPVPVDHWPVLQSSTTARDRIAGRWANYRQPSASASGIIGEDRSR
jgi:hypothetical protein